MQSLLKVALLSLMLIAVSLGPVPAGTGSQPERPYSVAQPYSVKQMGKLAGTKSQPERPYSVAQVGACQQNGITTCWYGARMMCLCGAYGRNCSVAKDLGMPNPALPGSPLARRWPPFLAPVAPLYPGATGDLQSWPTCG
jgi:hypothetical protein